jgi:hypothetical protein
MNKREETIQNLLRHAFVCLSGNSCSCAKNIQDFLRSDKISAAYEAGVKSNKEETK